jgi:hypothetical protein
MLSIKVNGKIILTIVRFPLVVCNKNKSSKFFIEGETFIKVKDISSRVGFLLMVGVHFDTSRGKKRYHNAIYLFCHDIMDIRISLISH